jgi:hypothetical protein
VLLPLGLVLPGSLRSETIIKDPPLPHVRREAP